MHPRVATHRVPQHAEGFVESPHLGSWNSTGSEARGRWREVETSPEGFSCSLLKSRKEVMVEWKVASVEADKALDDSADGTARWPSGKVELSSENPLLRV